MSKKEWEGVDIVDEYKYLDVQINHRPRKPTQRLYTRQQCPMDAETFLIENDGDF